MYYTGICLVFTILLTAAVALNINISNNEHLPETEIITPEITEQPEIITDFSNSAFIGDSRTQGLMLYSGIADAVFYTETGLTVKDVVEAPIINEETTIIQAVEENNFKRIYIMLGINELGWAYSASFEEAYSNMLTEIKHTSPDSEIIVQTIMPVNRELMKNPKEYVNNERISEFNDIIKKVCNSLNVKYIDTHSIMCDENGNLYEQASTDGIHLNLEFCQRWLKFLKGEKLDEI